jgi:hypothetical protein
MTGLLRAIKVDVSKLFLFFLMLVVYSESKVLTMIFLSLWGSILGVTRVSGTRMGAVTSLIHYGAEVLQHGL